MEFLGFLLTFVGFFGFIIFLVIFIIMAILKKQKAPFAITMGCCFASLIVGLFLFGKSGSTTNLNDNSPQSNENVLNLQGEWKQENSGLKETYHGAYINGDTIEIYWVNKGTETISLYWAGTFEQPESSTKSFTWESKNDTRVCFKTIRVSKQGNRQGRQQHENRGPSSHIWWQNGGYF